MWKIANVTPIFKKGDKQLIKNYRPISLLPICGKILEKIIFNNLYAYLHRNNLITKNYSGFRPGDSTTNQLLYLLDEIHQAFDSIKSLEVRAVFLDISKAFDKVWHDGLIFKLDQNGISGNLLRLLQNYLDDRKQRVAINGSYSDSLIHLKKKCIFGIHDPLGLRYIFQLRVGLSSLRCHKNRHNFINTPSDMSL